MSRFADILKQTSERLDLPQPEKSRILLEIASDLEDMYEHYRGQGMSDEEAVGRAREKLAVSDEALAELVQIHESVFCRLLGRISGQAQTRWERVLLTALVVFIAVFTGREVVSTQLYGTAGRFVWPVLGVAFMAALVSVFQVYRLYIKKDHDIRRLRTGFPWLITAGCASMLIGLYGAMHETYRSVRLIIAEIEMSLVYAIHGALRCSAILIVSLLVSVAVFLVWFALANKVKRIEEAEAAWLIE
jgi:hypothetical protein